MSSLDCLICAEMDRKRKCLCIEKLVGDCLCLRQRYLRLQYLQLIQG